MERSLFLAATAAVAFDLLRRMESRQRQSGGPAAGLFWAGLGCLGAAAFWQWGGGMGTLALFALGIDWLALARRSVGEPLENLPGSLAAALLLASATGAGEAVPYILGAAAAALLSAIAGSILAQKAEDPQLGGYLGAVLLTALAFLLAGLLPEREGLGSFAAVSLGIAAGLLLGELGGGQTARPKPLPGSGPLRGPLSLLGAAVILGGTLCFSLAVRGPVGIALASVGMAGTGAAAGDQRDPARSAASGTSGVAAVGSSILPALALFAGCTAAEGVSFSHFLAPRSLAGLPVGGAFPFLLLVLLHDPAPAGRMGRFLRGTVFPGLTALLGVLAVGLPLGKSALLGFLAGTTAAGSLLVVLAAGIGKGRAVTGEQQAAAPETAVPKAAADGAADIFREAAGPALCLLLRMMDLAGFLLLPFLG